MKPYQKKIVVIFLLAAIYSGTYSQIPQRPYNVQSPNVAAMMLYGEVPVSHFTGTPNISIPLYTIDQGQFSESISLSYHASGFRPDQHPGWTGVGWNLNAGGVISRVVRDMEDEEGREAVGHPGSPYGFAYHYPTIINITQWDQIPHLKDIALNYNLDTEPDEFSFSFNGYNGKFYIDSESDTLAWKVKCDKPVKVRLCKPHLMDVALAPVLGGVDLGRKTFRGFEIITEDGTVYEFGNTNSSIEYTTDFFLQHETPWTASSWYLTKITTIKGDIVTYSYTRGHFINQMYISNSSSEWSVSPSPGVSDCTDSYTVEPSYLSYQGSLISPVYMDEINTVNTKIKFTSSTSNELRYRENLDLTGVYEPRKMQFPTGFLNRLKLYNNTSYPTCLANLQWRQLDKIEVFHTTTGSSNLLKSFNFTYSSDPSKRLTLFSLKEKGSDGTENKPFLFRYDESLPLPGYLEFTTDHWGFYNNKYSGNITNLSNYISLREPDEDYSKPGTLIAIIYPTGGATSFEYEPHTYSKQLRENRVLGIDPNFNVQKYAGGLRIKKITSVDPTLQVPEISKEYVYDKFGVSTGILGGQSKYYFPGYRLYNNDGHTWTQNVFSTQSALPASINAAGSHIGYSEVTEIYGDDSYKVFTFSNFGTTAGNSLDEASVTLQPDLTNYQPVNSLEVQRGKLLTETWHSSSNAIVKTRNLSYSAINKANGYVRAIKAKRYNPCSNWVFSLFTEATAYKNFTFSYLPTTETVTEAGFTTTKTYNYDLNKRLLTSESVVNSDGSMLTTTYKRPYDLTSTSVYAQMASANILSPVIEETRSSGLTQVSKTENVFSATSGKFYHDLTRSQTSSSSPWVIRSMFTYDDKMNVRTSAVNSTSPITTYLLSYSGQYPVAKIENAPYSAVVSALGGQSAIDALRDSPNPSKSTVASVLASLRTSPGLKEALITTYTYFPLIGLSGMTDANGLTTSYEYDSFQRLQNVKDSNGDIIKNYRYNTRPVVFYNEAQSDVFTKSNCVSGLDGGDVIFKVPAFKYYSTVDQSTANNLAIADLYANGQSFADSKNACLIYARYEVENIAYDGYPSGSGYYTEESGDVYIRFYADMACTVPLILPYDVTVKGRETYNQHTNFGSLSFFNDSNEIGYQGTNNIYMGNYVLNSNYTYTGGWESTTWLINVIADENLPYLIPQQTLYHY